MYLLGHESLLRRQFFGTAGVDVLWGRKSNCLWKRQRIDLDHTVRTLRLEPARACQELGLQLADALRLFDELMVHAKYGAALDLASYLASTPGMLDGGKRVKGLHVYDPRILVFFRHMGAKVALAGGIYERARSLLQQSERIIRDVGDSRDSWWLLLDANQHLLWGRLEQLLWLPDRSFASFEKTRPLFERAKTGVPAGLDLLEHRSKVAGPPNGGHHIPPLPLPERRGGADNLYGNLAAHYYDYLCGRGALHSRDWTRARHHLDLAQAHLERDGHAGFVDPIRLGNIVMCQGRVLAGRGLEIGGSTAEVEQGILLLHEAREIFKTHDFPPGEYKAYTDYIQVKAALDEKVNNIQPSGRRLPLLKEAVRLSRKTSVPVFRVASGVEHADTLRKAGRMNRAQIAIEEVRRIDSAALAHELGDTELARKVSALQKVTARARENSVEPLDQWGLSEYSLDEQAFVQRAAASKAAICVSGLPGTGRRLQIARIQEARAQQPGLWEINSSVLPDEIGAQLRRKLQEKQCVLLAGLDEWSLDRQRSVAALLRDNRRWHPFIYVTMRSWMDGVKILDANLVQLLSDWHLEVKPLADREEDALMLARGLLVRACLAETPSRMRPEDRITEPRDLILSGAACDFVRRHFRTVGEINRAMRYLATRLRATRDVITVQHSRAIVTVEAMERHLPGPGRIDSTDQETASKLKPTSPDTLGPEVKNADVATIHSLAKRFGSLAELADAAGVQRTTLIEAWKKRRVKQAWDEARLENRRTHRRR